MDRVSFLPCWGKKLGHSCIRHYSVDHFFRYFQLTTRKDPETNLSEQFKPKAEGRELGGGNLSITLSLKVSN